MQKRSTRKAWAHREWQVSPRQETHHQHQPWLLKHLLLPLVMQGTIFHVSETSDLHQTRDCSVEGMIIKPTELHSQVLQNGKQIPIVRLPVATEPAQAHQLEQGYWQGHLLPRRVTDLHLFISTIKLQQPHHLPQRNFTTPSPRQGCKINQPLQILLAADTWYRSMH